MTVRLSKLEVVYKPESYPDLSYLEQEYNETKSPVTRRLYRKQDRERLAAYNRDEWHMMNVYAVATITIDSGSDPAHNVNWITRQTVRSSGIGGVESDADTDHLASIAEQELEELRGILAQLGVEWDAGMAVRVVAA